MDLANLHTHRISVLLEGNGSKVGSRVDSSPGQYRIMKRTKTLAYRNQQRQKHTAIYPPYRSTGLSSARHGTPCPAALPQSPEAKWSGRSIPYTIDETASANLRSSRASEKMSVGDVWL
jgi:hypothetical protein